MAVIDNDMHRNTIAEWQQVIHEVALEHGWWDSLTDERDLFAAIGWKLLLCVTEVAEAAEELRSNHAYGETYYKLEDGGGQKPEGFAIELADVVIRVLDLAERLDIDLGEAMEKKVQFNAKRSHRHGGKKV